MSKNRNFYQCEVCKSEFIITIVETDYDELQFCPFCKNDTIKEFLDDDLEV